MSKVVEVPGVGNVEFPDAMTDDQIANAISTEGSAAPEAPQQRGLGAILEPFARTAKGFAQAAAAIPSGWYQLGSLAAQPKELLDILTHPSIIGEAAVETGKQLAPAIPATLGGILGGVAGGPAGVPLGTMAGQGMYEAGKQLITGKPQSPRESLTNIATAGLGAAAGGAIPKAVELAKKAPGRYLSLPSERHATAAEMLGDIPKRFGVDDATVNSMYSEAEQLAMRSPVSRAPLTNLQNAMDRMGTQVAQNPIPAITGPQLPKQLGKMQSQMATVSGGVDARQMNGIVKAINRHLDNPADPDRGMWKQMLSAVHNDIDAAARATGDPAFEAYAKAIQTARMNFLKRDIEEAITLSGIREQRTGNAVIAAPGNLQRWMRNNPEWAKNVESVRPGLLQEIQRDIQEIIPIADYVGRSIPGQRFGSGRLALGASAGHLLNRWLGLPPGTAESIGAILAGISPNMGVSMSPSYIRSSFQPLSSAGSTAGGVTAAGSLMQMLQGGRP